MRLAATTVSYEGYSDERGNEQIIKAANAALAEASRLVVDALVLPGGFLSASATRVRDDVANAVIDLGKRWGVAVFFGVDQEQKVVSKDWKREITGVGLPWYGYAWSPAENIVHVWRQRTFNRDNQWWISDERCEELRLVRLIQGDVAVLLCGEMFNQRIRSELARHRSRFTVVIDMAHTSKGLRYAGLRVLSNLGIPAICSVHTARAEAKKPGYLPGVGNVSTRDMDGYVEGPPRIELKVWEF